MLLIDGGDLGCGELLMAVHPQVRGRHQPVRVDLPLNLFPLLVLAIVPTGRVVPLRRVLAPRELDRLTDGAVHQGLALQVPVPPPLAVLIPGSALVRQCSPPGSAVDLERMMM